ncbi:hypothetical protein NRIC_01990 [Enterococcus florum]|uniref:Uncharacterized protein n=1 Tax=Enterococcus florum TaxID=2480627 RepID=A0A4P5P8P1_9ENTE|nr:hypothetical protein NRIC_01990 [Enterococcus florum]
MRKVPPIVKPIALLTLSTIIATATGVANGASYRGGSGASSTTINTEGIQPEESATDKNSSESAESTLSIEQNGPDSQADYAQDTTPSSVQPSETTDESGTAATLESTETGTSAKENGTSDQSTAANQNENEVGNAP